jgi:hypothetical protein
MMTAKTWESELPTMNVNEMKPIFDPLEGVQADARRQLSASKSHRRRPPRRRLLDLRQQTAAAAAIGVLPLPGETVHLVCDGSYKSWHHIPVILEQIAPAKLVYLGIFTLSFSQENISELCRMMDVGQVEALDLCYSCYFRSVERGACEKQTAELTRRGARVASFRTHAKAILMKTTAGDCYTIESSANLRSAGNLEQSTLTNDAALFAFYCGIIEELLTEAKR